MRAGRLAAFVGHRQAGGSPHPVLGHLQGPSERAGEPIPDAQGPLTAGQAAHRLSRHDAPRAPADLRRGHAQLEQPAPHQVGEVPFAHPGRLGATA